MSVDMAKVLQAQKELEERLARGGGGGAKFLLRLQKRLPTTQHCTNWPWTTNCARKQSLSACMRR